MKSIRTLFALLFSLALLCTSVPAAGNTFQDIPVNAAYAEAVDWCVDHKLMNGAGLVSANGSKKELNSLMEFAQANGQDLFLQTDITNVY